MKKYFTTAAFVAVFAFYAVYQHFSASSASAPAPVTTSAVSAPLDTKQTSKPLATTKPAPTPVSRGQYSDGTYTGNVADAYYGYIQVQARVSGGRLADVTFLQYPSDRSTSRYINSQAMPILKSEAIAAQSARVDTVSGASDTSAAFVESLSSALSQARA